MHPEFRGKRVNNSEYELTEPRAEAGSFASAPGDWLQPAGCHRGSCREQHHSWREERLAELHLGWIGLHRVYHRRRARHGS